MKTGIFTHRQGAVREHVHSSHNSLISWKAIIGGLFVAMITYVTLIALGVGMGAASVSEVIQEGSDPSGLAGGAALWLGISTFLSLALGSYFAARTSTFITDQIGAAQGLILAAVFFAFMIYGAGQTIGIAGRGLGNVVSSVGGSASSLASNTTLQNTIENSLAGTELKSEPSTVIQGLLTRLIRGDSEGAKTYLSYQTGLSEAELNARYARLETEFKATAQAVGVKAAEGVSKAAWNTFWILIAGIIMSVFSGALGARVNLRKPLTDEAAAASHLDAHPVL